MNDATCACGKPVRCRGLCESCYRKWCRAQKKAGAFVSAKTRPPEVRFFEKVDKNGPVPAHNPELGPCWVWTGYTRADGYGEIHWNGKPWLAPRFAYTYFVGAIPEGLDVRHHCDNPPCVNLAHLIPGTRSENMQDMVERGRDRWQKDWLTCDRGHDLTIPGAISFVKGKKRCRECKNEGERRAAARKRGGPPRKPKLSAEDVAEIRARRADGVPLKVLAAEYGIGKSYVCAITKGRSRGPLAA